MKKLLCLALAVLMMSAIFTSCSKKADNSETAADSQSESNKSETPVVKTDVSVGVLNGPTGMGAAKLIKDASENSAANNYKFANYSSPDQIVSDIVNGSLDIAAVPANLAAVLYKKTSGNINVIAYNTLGVLYVLENGDTIHSVEDLRGKTIYATGQGATPEYILKHILSANNIDPENDITIEFKADHAELASLMSEGKVVLSMLPEPQVTAVLTKNNSVRVALNLTEEWNKTDYDSKLIQGCLIAQKGFIDEHKDAVDSFISEYAASAEYVNQNPKAASEFIAQFGIVANAAVAENAIPNCNITCVSGEEMKTGLSGMFKILFDANPSSVGGAVPDDEIFYIGE